MRIYINSLQEGKQFFTRCFFKPKSAKDFIAQFTIDNPKTKLKDPFTAFGFYKALEEMTTGEVRELLKKYPKWAWFGIDFIDFTRE